MNEVYTAPY
jgi:hypothetical protein